MPMNRADYPDNWEELRTAVLKRAGDRCECIGECGVEHSEHDGEGGGIKADDGREASGRCQFFNRDGLPSGGRVILTTAHLCRDSKCDDLFHLKSMCQGCHLRYDKDQHADTRARNRDAKRGQERLC